MSEATLHRTNNDRIVVHAFKNGWQVTYYRATPIRGSWLRRMFAEPPLFRERVQSISEIHRLLLHKGMHLSRAETQRLHNMLLAQNRRDEMFATHAT